MQKLFLETATIATAAVCVLEMSGGGSRALIPFSVYICWFCTVTAFVHSSSESKQAARHAPASSTLNNLPTYLDTACALHDYDEPHCCRRVAASNLVRCRLYHPAEPHPRAATRPRALPTSRQHRDLDTLLVLLTRHCQGVSQ
jgi:hypothetical protein